MCICVSVRKASLQTSPVICGCQNRFISINEAPFAARHEQLPLASHLIIFSHTWISFIVASCEVQFLRRAAPRTDHWNYLSLALSALFRDSHTARRHAIRFLTFRSRRSLLARLVFSASAIFRCVLAPAAGPSAHYQLILISAGIGKLFYAPPQAQNDLMGVVSLPRAT
jgi:hypothetical protein